MKKQIPDRPVERLFPFVLRSHILIVGRDMLARSKSNLQFVLITHDISETSQAEILSDFKHYPIIQYYTVKELEKFFGINGAKVIGFKKSDLAQSLYATLKKHRINKPFQQNNDSGTQTSSSGENGCRTADPGSQDDIG